ncbi:HAMP domain-containing sensor histidine kinase [Phenylobacterium montanum]|uniref:histidine kinase n=1 Tax=Phenylobacterium montanum TaxID=2823693 RepID=A0A975G3I7_9CAUL|nr:HAMP domain-containing sensor histidine kinase [Caulobacter sp. S6]QUD90220.1 HAMP domain-containing histidine kinase [Caulobacter sp. S6]
MKPGRLFWKLFLAFWLATGCSFLIGASLLKATQGDPGGAAALASAARRIIETDGLDAARPLLEDQRKTGGPLALYDLAGRLVGGDGRLVLAGGAERLTAPDGGQYLLAVAGPRVVQTTPLLIGAAVSFVFSAAVAWYLALPLAHLSQGFRAVAAGQLATRVVPQIGRRRDEIADLAREFDGMAAQLQLLWLAQQRLLHNVSHELRSPLARLHVAIGLLRQSPDRQTEMLARVEREADRLESLLSELLTLARLRAGESLTATETIDLLDLLAAIVEDANFEAQVRGCHVRLAGEAPFVTFADGELLYRAFENVIRNALKYSPPDGEVVVQTSLRGERLRIEVIDQGPGVPEATREEIFEPFKRLEGEKDATDGFGLGLALAREAVEHHAGEVRAEAGANGAGLRIVIEIPRRTVADDLRRVGPPQALAVGIVERGDRPLPALLRRLAEERAAAKALSTRARTRAR